MLLLFERAVIVLLNVKVFQKISLSAFSKDFTFSINNDIIYRIIVNLYRQNDKNSAKNLPCAFKHFWGSNWKQMIFLKIAHLYR